MKYLLRHEKRKVYRLKAGSRVIALPHWWLKQVADYYGCKPEELKEINVYALDDILILCFRNREYVERFLEEVKK